MVVWPKTSGSVATLSLEQCPDVLSEICRGVTLKYCGKILQIYENTISHLLRMYASLCLFMLNHRVQYVSVVVIRPNIIQRNRRGSDNSLLTITMLPVSFFVLRFFVYELTDSWSRVSRFCAQYIQRCDSKCLYVTFLFLCTCTHPHLVFPFISSL